VIALYLKGKVDRIQRSFDASCAAHLIRAGHVAPEAIKWPSRRILGPAEKEGQRETEQPGSTHGAFVRVGSRFLKRVKSKRN
jgi:hypothetical protein